MSNLTAYRVGRLIDGTGSEPVDDQVIVVDGTDVVAIQRGEDPVPESARLVDLSSFTVVPGLINTHVHVSFDSSFDIANRFKQDADWQMYARMIGNGQRALASGTTTLKDNGGRGPLVLQYRDALEERLVEGPTVYACGDTISNEPGPFDNWVARNPDEVRETVRKQLEAGGDFIHMAGAGGRMAMSGHGRRSARFDTASFRAAVDEAAKFGKYVYVDSHAAEGIRNAAEAGCRAVEHPHFLGKQDGFDLDDDLIQTLLDRKVYLIPTSAISYQRTEPVNEVEATWARDELLGPWEERREVLRHLHEAGVMLVAGSDAGGFNVPFDDYSWEFEQLVDCGLTPMEAIISGTRLAAECMGVEDRIGTIAPGKQADFFATVNDPSRCIAALREVVTVVARGNQVVVNTLVS